MPDSSPVRGTVTEEMVEALRAALGRRDAVIRLIDGDYWLKGRVSKILAVLSSDGERARLVEENEALRAVLGDKVVPYLLRQRRRPQRLLNTIREALSPAPEAKGTEER